MSQGSRGMLAVRVQISWDKMRDLKVGGFLAHRSPLESEDETEIRAASAVGRSAWYPRLVSLPVAA